MAYNTGVFTLFNQSATVTNIRANYRTPVYQLKGSINSLATSSIAPSATITGTATIGSFYSQYGAMTLQVSNSRVTNAYSVFNVGPYIFAGTVSNAYGLYVVPASGAGTIQNNFSAYFDGGGVGLNTASPMNTLDVAGNVAVGTFAGNLVAPTNSMIISGLLGIGTASPTYTVQVLGQAGATRIYSAGTTQINQLIQVSEGISQGSGSYMPGTQLTMSSATTDFFDTSSVQSNSVFFAGSVFDGRYLYLVPFNNNNSGQITRYDTTQSFSSSTNYAFYNTTALQSLSSGFNGGSFDGRYVYLAPFTNSVLARYDTAGAFSASTSYNFFNLTSVQSNGTGFSGAVFDGRYMYFIPDQGALTVAGVVFRYDTTLSFNTTVSYSTFDTSSLQSNSVGFSSGTFDGRYVYMIPYTNLSSYTGQITRYDTSSVFSSSLSYSFFNLQTLDSFASGFSAKTFDGRYIYMGTYGRGVLARYDTTMPFSTSLSYNFFDTSTLQSNSAGFGGGVFDGRYLYLSPLFNNTTQTYYGQITRYDVTRPLSNSLSYSFFNTKSLQSHSAGFYSCISDGRYVYFVPYFDGRAGSGLITRMASYISPPLQALNTYAAPNGLTLLGGGGISLSNIMTQGTAPAGGSVSVSQVQGYLVLNINGVSRKIPFYAN